MKLGKFIKINNDYMPYNVTLQEVVNSMMINNVKHIVLLDDKIPLAIITERDILFLYTNHTDFNNPALDFATKNLIVAKENRKIDYALNLMVDNNIRRVIVVDKERNYLGSISQEEIIFEFEQDVYKSHIKISDLIKPNNRAVYIQEDQSLQDAINAMSGNNIGSVLIYDKNTNPIGIITESDVVSFAQKHIDTNEKVTLYMHFPIVSFNDDELLHNIVRVMKEKNIRRILISHKKENQFYVITSKDILNNLKGNYSIYLESKLRDVKKTFNLLDETVIELFDYENEQIIHWFNKKAKDILDINIDDEITKIIPANIWNKVYEKIKNKTYKDNQLFEINNRLYKLIAIHTIVLGNSVIKILFDDITGLVKEDENNLDIYKKSLDSLPSAIALINDKYEIIYKNKMFELDSNDIKDIIDKNNISFFAQETCTLKINNQTFFYKKIDVQLYLINFINH